jgi:hypothetical protein
MKQHDIAAKGVSPVALIALLFHQYRLCGDVECADQENEGSGSCLSWLRAKPSALNSCRKSTKNHRTAREIISAPVVTVSENTDMTHVSEVATLLRQLADYSGPHLAEAEKRAADDRLQQPLHPVMQSSSAHGKRQNSEK